MSGQQALWADGPDRVLTDEEHLADLRARECDPTPRGVVRAALTGLSALLEPFGPPAFAGCCPLPSWGAVRVLDWCAGSGVWSSEMRIASLARGVETVITAVESDPTHLPYLAEHCDDWAACDWRMLDLSCFDVLLGNPAFSQIFDGLEAFALAAGANYRACALILASEQLLTRTATGRAFARSWPPRFELLIPGGVRFRGPGTAQDRVGYSVFGWSVQDFPSSAGPGVVTWPCHLLPELPATDRGWSTFPGRELKTP